MNPFSFVRGVVSGKNYIPRKEITEWLVGNTIGGSNSAIVGLPRVGKTSLIKNIFEFNNKGRFWYDNYKLIPLVLDLSTVANESQFWYIVAKRMAKELNGIVCSKEQLLGENVKTSSIDCYEKISSCAKDLLDNYSVRLIFVIDEFDKAMTFPSTFFSRLKAINNATGTSIVTCSRRTLEFIEKMATEKFYSSDASNCHFLGEFTQEEVDEYWKRFECHFERFGEKQFEKYKALVDRYVGRHPMLISIMNAWLFRQGSEIFGVWNEATPKWKCIEVEREIRVEIDSVFKRQLEYVREQGLLDSAINLVLGASQNTPPEHKDLLIKYTFIKKVPNKQKHDIFGYDLGPTTGDRLNRYICFSELTSHIMNEKYQPSLSEFELIRETEKKLRSVVEYRLKMLCGNRDPFDMDDNEHERWEVIIGRKIENNCTVDQKKEFYDSLEGMYDIRIKREKNDTNPSFDRTNINMLTSSTLGQLWYVFIKWEWWEYYSRILDPENVCKNDREEWRMSVFMPILIWRNALYHVQDEELTDDQLAKAENAAKNLCRIINNWLASNNH